MSIFRFNKTPKNQKFEYRPRYFNPDKEELDARLSKYKNGGDPTSSVKSGISRGFRRRSSKGYSGGLDSRRSNKRLLIILVALIFATYFFISQYLPQIVELIK